MAFVDELKIHIEAGRGGDGVVRWLHEKGKEFMGPAGGNGGKGGDVYVLAIPDLGKLAHYRHKKEFKAEDGEHGKSRSKHGKDGEDLVIEIPAGSVVTNLDIQKEYDVKEIGERVLILKGGRGGLGNEHFKASTNVKPRESTLGKDGEKGDFVIELRITAKVALIGLPNAGKSSLLNSITNAEAKVGDYEFTTLEPNLGSLYGMVIADIPGLIKGAGEGKGLGHKFLRHIMRAEALFHCISLENEDLIGAYETIRNEMKAFNPELLKKKEVVIFTKIDEANESILKEKLAIFENKYPKMKHFEISIYDDQSLQLLKKEIRKPI